MGLSRSHSTSRPRSDWFHKSSKGCAHDPGWTYILDYKDDKDKNDIPDDADQIYEGFDEPNAFFIGMHRLTELGDLDNIRVCAKRYHQSKCLEECFILQAEDLDSLKLCSCKHDEYSYSRLQLAVGVLAGAVSAEHGQREDTSCRVKVLNNNWTCPQYFEAEYDNRPYRSWLSAVTYTSSQFPPYQGGSTKWSHGWSVWGGLCLSSKV